ncbi:MAG TPA: restriction endonuclease [Flavobacterium lutivivi]|nr:restriction endonuclease [Flavobacterium lutivivi]
MKIVKHSGNIVDFKREKLRDSLLKSGASRSIVEDVISQIEKQLYEGISTKKIYKLAFGLLKKNANSHAARYNLRVAIQLLGPAGFFFEKYIAKLFQSEGYETLTNLLLQGKCVSHEVDVVVRKNNYLTMIECKFHAGRDAVSDVKVPMYIFSRFNDLKTQKLAIFEEDNVLDNCFIITNNRFTADAIQFARCSNISLLSWDYPDNENLRDKIDRSQLYPVTCLTTLTLAEKDRLMNVGIILVKELLEDTECLKSIDLSQSRVKNVIRESSELCKYI